MRCEVSVDLHGPGRAPAEALQAVRDALGDACRDVHDWPGAIRVSLEVEAGGLDAAIDRARDLVQLAAARARLDDWAVTSWEGRTPEVRGRWGVTRHVSLGGGGFAMGTTSEGPFDDGDPSGDREPRGPKPDLPGLSASADEP